MSFTPAKVKAELARIKEKFLDTTPEDGNDAKSPYLTLLRLELVQRGVLLIVPTSASHDDDDDDDDTEPILSRVTATAGKELAAAVPAPLLAGSCIVASRLAEQLLLAHTNKSTTSTPPLLRIPSSSQLAPVIARCKDVDDPRLLVLLEWGVAASSSSVQRVGGDPDATTIGMLHIAEAYSLRAAQLQPDIPMPWKRSWDCCMLLPAQRTSRRSSSAWPAITAVTNLRRIANSKGNQKRVIELSLVLMDCYLDGHYYASNNTTTQQSSLVATYRPTQPPKNCLQLAKALEKETSQQQPPPADATYWALLRYRLARANNDDDDTDLVLQYGATIQQLYVQPQASSSEHAMAIVEQLQSHLVWWKTLATRKQQQHAQWQPLSMFLQPLVEHWIATATAVEDGAERDFQVTVAKLIASIEWMLLGDVTRPFSDKSLQWADTVLHSTITTLSAKEAAATSSAIGNVNAEDASVLDHCRSARAAFQAHRVLRGTTADDNDGRAVADTATTAKRTYQSCSDYGVSFLQCLVCWSGLHRSPWMLVTQSEARMLVQRATTCLTTATTKAGRPVSALERALLQLSEADAEGSGYDSGLANKAVELYTKLLSEGSRDCQNEKTNDYLVSLVSIRSEAGLADIESKAGDYAKATTAALRSLELLDEAMKAGGEKKTVIWTFNQFSKMSQQFQKADVQRLLANTYLHSGEVARAQDVLEQALKDAPNDAGANFALGSFRLYRAFFLDREDSAMDKEAQVQLLKAAKMDSSKASPFALLGVWYERKSDLKRALGCYSKALVLDPSHPVAGRGVIRLAPPETLDTIFDTAVKAPSSSIGWAWRRVGLRKAMRDGENELAVVALLKTLRCSDIERPESNLLAPFFANPRTPERPNKKEMAATLTDLAMCYRRLGRYTAAVRSFHSAIGLWGDDAPAQMLCSCAQVELELGLLDDAEKNFSAATARADSDVLTLSAYGQISAILLMARRDAQDGKQGSAFALMTRGIQVCSDIKDLRLVCILKASGDLHSFAASLPPDLFYDPGETNATESLSLTQMQLAFVGKAEPMYQEALEMAEDDGVRVGLATDIGSNRLLRAHIEASASRQGLRNSIPANVKDLYLSAADAFKSAIEIDAEVASAWCGLGCSVIHTDVLLAQHAFVRSMELDKLAPATYANLSFLYTKEHRLNPSSQVSNLLSEVADTPMMWINRAAILEIHGDKEAMQQACDAYSAALQVARIPTALAGFAMSCRQNPTVPNPIHQSCLYGQEYLGVVGKTDALVASLHITQQIELLGGKTYPKGDILAHIVEAGQCFDHDGTHLDVEVFRRVADCARDAGPLTPAKVQPEHPLQRQVANDPSNGSLWLQLSKQLATQSATDPSLVAAKRASSLLSAQLLTTKASTGYMDANELADSLALAYCLESIQDAKTDETSKATRVDLQRALFMDPGNRIGRHVLQSNQSSE